jgi:F0F1-type ATP synthase gamma subunit
MISQDDIDAMHDPVEYDFEPTSHEILKSALRELFYECTQENIFNAMAASRTIPFITMDELSKIAEEVYNDVEKERNS